MSNLNQVTLQGNLTEDIELRYTETTGEKRAIANFSIAINNGFGDKATTTFINCVAFGKQAEIIAKFFSKGRQILVRGALHQNKWETPEGEKRSRIEVRLENFGGFYFTGNAPASEDTASEAEPVAVTKGGGDGEPIF